MSLLQDHPLFAHLQSSRRILIAGAGGGFDIYSGLPLYLSLRRQGKEVFLANYSFTALQLTDALQVSSGCYQVTADTREEIGNTYFPEKNLCLWLRTLGIEVPVYAFGRMGVQPLKQAYEHLIRTLSIDTIVLADGGTDSLMFGDEEGLGTPLEDITSMAAVHQCAGTQHYMVNIGFGIDHHHGVSHYRFLENVAALARSGGFLGAFSLLKESEEGLLYADAVAFANTRMRGMESVVSNSIVSAMEGQYGDHHATSRTTGSELWINPLMSLYWCFRLEAVIGMNKYYPLIRDTSTERELWEELTAYIRTLAAPRESRQLPI